MNKKETYNFRIKKRKWMMIYNKFLIKLIQNKKKNNNQGVIIK